MDRKETDLTLAERAKALAKAFNEQETEYHLGFLEAEQANPLTRGLGETAQRDPEEAVRMILRVDCALADTFERVIGTDDYLSFARRVREVIGRGGRLILSGCGATGRLCLNLEMSWRRALLKAAEDDPVNAQALRGLSDRVVTIMTGGDYALIKSVESFEDHENLGRAQAAGMNVGPDDLLIGVTATGETTSILGTALEAASRGASVEMIVCSDPKIAAGRLRRVAELYAHERVHYVYIPCGAMAVAGSTRMQSSTIEQLVCGSAIQEAMREALIKLGLRPPEKRDHAADFKELVRALSAPRATAALGRQAALEADMYRAGKRLCYFADEYLLDVLSDTTERSPTFLVPPFLPEGKKGEPSWAFVKDPGRPTREAWQRCLMHRPRCISWSLEDYRRLGAPVTQAPRISEEDLYRFPIGCEPDAAREQGPGSLAVWVGSEDPGAAFDEAAARYHYRTAFTLKQMGVQPPHTGMDLMGHLAMKIALNTVSTVSMGKMGRLTSNYMTWMDMSNKKLVDRSARLIVQECGVDYLRALEELYLSKLEAQEDPSKAGCSPVQSAIRRLKSNGFCA